MIDGWVDWCGCWWVLLAAGLAALQSFHSAVASFHSINQINPIKSIHQFNNQIHFQLNLFDWMGLIDWWKDIPLVCLVVCLLCAEQCGELAALNPHKKETNKPTSFPLLSALHASWISFSFVYVGRSSSLLAGCLWRSALITHHQTNSAGQLQQNQKKIHSAYAWGRRQLNKPN